VTRLFWIFSAFIVAALFAKFAHDTREIPR